MVLAALRGCFGPAGVPRVPWVLLVALRGCHSPCRGAAGCVACCSKHCYAASGNPQTCSLRNDSLQKIFSRKGVLVDIWFLDLCSLLVPHDLSSTRMCMWFFLFKASMNLSILSKCNPVRRKLFANAPRTTRTMATEGNTHQGSRWGNGC